jgi:arylsulfatase A-like enzyme
VPCIIRWPGKIKPGTVENGIFSGLDWLPTLAAAAGNPNITDQLLKGVTLEGRTYKNHLDGYNQMDLLLGKGPSARHEIFYFGGPQLGAIRLDDFKFVFIQQPNGWPGEKLTTDFMARELWRFVYEQQRVAGLAQTAVEYPPMQAPASFNLEAVKREIEEMIKAHSGQ